MQTLIDALLAGNHVAALAAARRLLAAGETPQTIVVRGIQAAMARLDEKCTIEAFNLLEIMLVGRAVSAVVGALYPESGPPPLARATFVIATLEGDIHDLGKNIVKMVLTGHGYRVVDCGKDCPVDTLANAAAREAADAVLVSGLITSVIPQVRKVRAALDARGLAAVPIVAGGAALRQSSAPSLNVDYVAEDAFDGARYLEARLARPVEVVP